MPRAIRQTPRHAIATIADDMRLNAVTNRPSSSNINNTPRPSQPPSAASQQQHQHIHQRPQKPNTRFLSLLLQVLIMSLVILLFFVFVGVAAIIFLHICIAGGALHRRRRRRSSSSNNRRSETRSGFSAAEVKTLPKIRYGGKTGEGPCPICLDEFQEGDWCRELPDCKHSFHSKCVDRWLAKVAGCPVCRTAVRLKGAGFERELAAGRGDGAEDCGQLWAVFV